MHVLHKTVTSVCTFFVLLVTLTRPMGGEGGREGESLGSRFILINLGVPDLMENHILLHPSRSKFSRCIYCKVKIERGMAPNYSL